VFESVAQIRIGRRTDENQNQNIGFFS